MECWRPKRTKPGLFVTGTDTEVGKTVITCAVAHALRRAGLSVGVCKPYASGCRKDREGLVSEDAEALAHFADCRQPLDVLTPVRFVAPLAPAVAAELIGEPVDHAAVGRSLRVLDAESDCVVVEGIGGVLVPLDPKRPELTVLDLAAALGYPVLVVARAGLGTLSHTAMTVRLIREAGCRVVGLAINGYVADGAGASGPGGVPDVSMSTNRVWLQKMTGAPVLATAPKRPSQEVVPHEGKLPADVLDAVAATYWPDVLDCPGSGC